MSTLVSASRALLLTLCLVGSAVVIANASKSEPVALRTPLAELPFEFGEYTGGRAADLDPEILGVLGVDEYLNRVYRAGEGRVPIGLYVGYYGSQRQGDTMHSPMNCLPGSGWQPVESGRAAIATENGPVEINRYLVEKGGERLLVLYWYQSHGRVVASEYWGKIYLVLDAMRLNRTDGALVRVVVPVSHLDSAGENLAESTGFEFVRSILPLLESHIPA